MTTTTTPAARPTRLIVVLVMVIFFVISLFTNTLGSLLPEIIATFHLSLTAAGLLPFSFFAAYGLASIPAGVWIERSSEKRVMIGAFALALLAALSFALVPLYGVAIGSLFTMGVAMASLQVALNPLLRVAGGASQFAFYSTMAQLVFGAGSFVSPRLYAMLALAHRPWQWLYWIFAAAALMMMVLIAFARLPSVERTNDERAGTLDTHRALIRESVIPRYFVSIFMYVGSEQGVASWISQFLATYHGVDPKTDGASAVSWFWGMMTIGCVIGLVLLKMFDSRRVLIGAASLAIILLAVGLFGSASMAKLAFPALGLAASVMWPIIFALALNSVPAHHGTVSGILCTAIIGGAIVPLVIGRIGDRFGLRTGMTLLFVTFAWVLSIGLWSKPTNSSDAAPAT